MTFVAAKVEGRSRGAHSSLEPRILRPKSSIHPNFCPQVEGRRTFDLDLRRREGRRSKSRRAFFASKRAFFAPNLRFISAFAPKSKVEEPSTLTFVAAKVEGRRGLNLRPSKVEGASTFRPSLGGEGGGGPKIQNLRFISTFAPKSKVEGPSTLTFVAAKVEVRGAHSWPRSAHSSPQIFDSSQLLPPSRMSKDLRP